MRTFWNNKTACSVLAELRDLLKARGSSRSVELFLVEELQVIYNRMESALADKRDIRDINAERCTLKDQYTKLYKEVEKLEVKLGKPKKKNKRTLTGGMFE